MLKFTGDVIYRIAVIGKFLYEAIFVSPGAQAPARSVLQLPQLHVYTENFGGPEGGFCFCGGIKKRSK